MANRSNDFVLLVKVTGKLDIHRIRREVNDGTVSANIENRVIVIRFYVGKLLGIGQLVLHNVIAEELRALIIGIVLDTALINWRVWTSRRGKVDLKVMREHFVRVRGFRQVPALPRLGEMRGMNMQ